MFAIWSEKSQLTAKFPIILRESIVDYEKIRKKDKAQNPELQAPVLHSQQFERCG